MLFQISNHYIYSNTRIESLILEEINKNPSLATANYSSLDSRLIKNLSQKAKQQCSSCVIGSLYYELHGVIYSFEQRASGITLAMNAYLYMKENLATLKQQNDLAWAKFLHNLNPSIQVENILSILKND